MEFLPGCRGLGGKLVAMRIAVLDLGSTTLHLEHFDLSEGTVARSLDEKITLRLGDHVFPKGHFDAATRARVIHSMTELLAKSAAQRPDRTTVVATSPFRNGTDGVEFAAQLARRFGVEVTILTPQQEAEFAYLGNATFDQRDVVRTAVVDIGGGSAEVAVGEGLRCLHALSLPLGAVRMGRLVAGRRPFGHAEARVLADALRDAVAEPLREVRALRPRSLVFASGTARAVRQLFMRDTALPGKTGPLSLDDLRHGLGEHLGSSPELLEAKGVDPARSDTVLVAASIMKVIAEAVGVEHFRISNRGLRDGVALETCEQVRRHPSTLPSSL